MKKILLAFFILFITFISFSCNKSNSSSNSSNTSSLLGKWKFTSGTPSTDFETCDFQGYIDIKTNNTYEEFDYCSSSTDYGSWSKNNNILTLVANNLPIPFEFTIVSLNSSNMHLQTHDLNDNHLVDLYYQNQ